MTPVAVALWMALVPNVPDGGWVDRVDVDPAAGDGALDGTITTHARKEGIVHEPAPATLRRVACRPSSR